MIAHNYGERWKGHHSAPRPPRDIELEMQEAGAANDQVRLGIAKSRYRAWLTDQGWNEPTHGNPAPGAPE